MLVLSIVRLALWESSWKEKEHVHRYVCSGILASNSAVTYCRSLFCYGWDNNPDYVHARGMRRVSLAGLLSNV